MSDDLATMTQKEMLRELYEMGRLRTASSAKLEAQIEEIQKRLDRRDKFWEKLSEDVAEQKVFIASMKSSDESVENSIKALSKKMDNIVDWQNEFEKKQTIKDEKLVSVEKKVAVLFKKADETDERLDNLENKSAQTVFSLVKKIGAIILGVIVTTIVGYFLGKMKGGM